MSDDPILYKAVHPENCHLAASRDNAGAFRGATLDNASGQLRGQAEFVPVPAAEDSGSVPVGALIGLVALVLSVGATCWAGPRLKRKWGDRSMRPRSDANSDQSTSDLDAMQERLATREARNCPRSSLQSEDRFTPRNASREWRVPLAWSDDHRDG
jgi:hypothetical protein